MFQPKPHIIRHALWRVTNPVPVCTQENKGPQTPWCKPDQQTRPVEAAPIDSQYFDIFSRPAPARSASWSIWWSDLMMTMFIMFAALYAFQIPRTSMSTPTEPNILPPPVVKENIVSMDPILDRIHGQLAATIARFEQDTMLTLSLVPDSAIHLVIHGNTLFSPGTSNERTPLHLCLQELAWIMKSSPYDLAVVGHASTHEAQNKKTDAWTLSMAKSSAVLNYLVQQVKFPAERIYMVGYGDQRPLGAALEVAQGHEDGRVELVLGTVNITAPLVRPSALPKKGFQQWLAATTQGE